MNKYTHLDKIETTDDIRIKTGVAELDDLLGGGFAKGQAILLAGEPGSGKSTLLLQLSSLVATQGNRVLYACGEESLTQVKGRADRLSVGNNPEIICSETINLEEVLRIAEETKPQFIIVDSLQMMYTSVLKQAPASPTQMRYCLDTILKYCKEKGITLIAIGHSTKSGLIAGLLTIQHMVDTTLRLEKGVFKTRSLVVGKNRYGPAQTGLELTMQENGFKELRPGLLSMIFNPNGTPSSSETAQAQHGVNNYYFKLENRNWAGLSLAIGKGILWALAFITTFTLLLPFAILKGLFGKKS